MKYLN